MRFLLKRTETKVKDKDLPPICSRKRLMMLTKKLERNLYMKAYPAHLVYATYKVAVFKPLY